jgi:hypothetical protein
MLPIDPAEAARALAPLRLERPRPDSRALVEEALASKFEGVQALGARVLGTWRDDASLTRLRHWFDSLIPKPRGWAIRCVAIQELAKSLGSDDVGWVLDLYFGITDGLLQHELRALAAHLPPLDLRTRLLAESRSEEASVRRAALYLLVRARFADQLSSCARSAQTQIQ